ncbi:MAG: 4Fe-4S binding protein [Deltaproteobacteria bacterium]|nr:4Fe-4S binding protein [Deltaproteobacteria bacterium]
MEDKEESLIGKLRGVIIIFLVFWIIAILFWQLKGKIFFLLNFGYIGTAIAVGGGAYALLPRKKKPAGRRFTQFLVGVYLLGFLGLIKYENMQIEGFFFYLLGGFFAASVIHYLVAKFFIPILYGRGWCGWACWTAMVLDYLPYKRNKQGRVSSKWEKLRYVHFGLSLALVLVLWFYYGYRPEHASKTEFIWLITGNALYFASGIILAFALKDNRAFCKYLCPITTILKISSRFALHKIAGDKEKCKECKACTRACPMDINIPEYLKIGGRVLSTECIFCQTCTTVCPEKNLSMTAKWDIGGKEILRRRN